MIHPIEVVMNNKTIVIILAAALVVAGGVAVVVMSGQSNEETVRNVTVIDGIGREVSLGKIDRITSVSAVPTAILCGLGLSSKLVAVSSDTGVYDEKSKIIGLDDDDFPAAVLSGLESGKIKGLGKMYNMSAETITTVNTDVVVCSEFGCAENTRTALDQLGIKYIVLKNEATFEIVLDNILLLGKAFNKEAKAEKMVSQMNNVIGKITTWCDKIVSQKLGGNAYKVCSMMTSTYVTGDKYISGTPLISKIGGTNPFGSVGKYAVISKESLVEKTPDVIIYTSLGMGDGIDNAADYIVGLKKDPVTKDIPACKNNRVFAVTGAAKNAMSYADQGMIQAYAFFAMFTYKDYLGFDLPTVLNGDNYSLYLDKFWDLVK